MRILYVIDSVVPAGAERSLLALVPHYVARDVTVEIAYLHDRAGLQDELLEAGARLTCVDGRHGRAGWLVRTTNLVRERRPALVHTTLFESDVVGRIAARLGGTPVVSTLAGAPYGTGRMSDPALRRWKLRSAQAVDGATARLTRRLHAVAASLADEMSQHLRYPRERIDVIPRGRAASVLGDRTEGRRAAARRALGVDASTPVVLAVGRHDHPKGLDVLIEALPALREACPGARVFVAGKEGAQTAELESSITARGLGPVVTLLGARDDVPDLMVGADVFVMPSRREGSPGALIEAMALELPAVVSDLTTVREVVDDTDAVIVPAGSPPALARGLVEAVGDPSAARVRAERAHEVYRRRFQIEAIADQMLDFYRRVLGGCP